mmetsp:Transcript_28021/g.37884  ORF Transcript_28021/g.37884 Transcript_28021/m.37884 type:complete len:95 (-) Transcript_28021:181-465(-)
MLSQGEPTYGTKTDAHRAANPPSGQDHEGDRDLLSPVTYEQDPRQFQVYFFPMTGCQQHEPYRMLKRPRKGRLFEDHEAHEESNIAATCPSHPG